MTNNNGILIPSDGMSLTNGQVYSKRVILGINDSTQNWSEIADSDIPSTDDDVDDATALAEILEVVGDD